MHDYRNRTFNEVNISMKNQQMNLNQLLDVVGPDLNGSSSEKLESLESKCSVKLEDKELWTKFKEYTNEMIVTKNGRYVLQILVRFKSVDVSFS